MEIKCNVIQYMCSVYSFAKVCYVTPRRYTQISFEDEKRDHMMMNVY